MGERANQLAATVQQACDDFIELTGSLGDEEWTREVPATGWPAGVTAHHLASSWGVATDFMSMIAAGTDVPPLSGGGLDTMNEDHARQFARVSKAETLALLRENRNRAVAFLDGLDDAKLDAQSNPLEAMGGGRATPEQFAQMVIIGHVEDHGGAIRSAIGR